MKPVKILSAILVGLWLSACTQAVSPDATQSKPDTSESKKEATVENTSAGQTTSREAAESEAQETREKLQTSRTAPPGATMPEKQETGENTSDSQTKSQDTAYAKLEAARENLRISQATEKRIAAELEQLKKSGNATPDVIKDYETYLKRVQAMVSENQKMVADMETAYAMHKFPPKQPGSSAPDEIDKMLNPKIPEQDAGDELDGLDRELDESLAQFDQMLLNEMDKIRAQSAQKMRDLAEEAAAAAKRLGDKGVRLGSSSSQTASESEEKDTGATPKENETGEGETQATAQKNSGEGNQGLSGDSKRYSGSEDDDIVARQLREAAENESDPELKAKLWKEYEEYKKNTNK